MTHKHLMNAVIGPASEMPAAGNPHGGAKIPPRGFYIQSDTGLVYESTGTAWTLVGQLGQATAVHTTTVDYTVKTTDRTIVVGAASKTITLPAATAVQPGTTFVVVNNGSGSSTTIATAAGNINGSATDTSASANYGVVRVVSDGANYFKV